MLEMLMDPLGALVVTFFVMSIISIISVALLYLLKNDKVKQGILYFLGVWGVVIAYCGVLITGGFAFSDGLPAILLGIVGVAGILMQLISKKEKKFEIARILVTISVMAGMINCFLW